MVRYRLPKKKILSNRKEISSILTDGSLWQNSALRIRFKPCQTSENRFAVIVSRKIGNAVVRNLAKRICRELFRLQIAKQINSFDIIIIPKTGVVPTFSLFAAAVTEFIDFHKKQEKLIPIGNQT